MFSNFIRALFIVMFLQYISAFSQNFSNLTIYSDPIEQHLSQVLLDENYLESDIKETISLMNEWVPEWKQWQQETIINTYAEVIASYSGSSGRIEFAKRLIQVKTELWIGLKKFTEQSSLTFHDNSGSQLLAKAMLDVAISQNSLNAIQAVFEIPNFIEQTRPINRVDIAKFLGIFSSLRKTECFSNEFIYFLASYYNFTYLLDNFDFYQLYDACNARYSTNLTQKEWDLRIQHLYKILPLQIPFVQNSQGVYDQYILTLLIKKLADPKFFTFFSFEHPSQVFQNIFENPFDYPIAGFVLFHGISTWNGGAESIRYMQYLTQLARSHSGQKVKNELDTMLISLRTALETANRAFGTDYTPERRNALNLFSKDLSKKLDQIFTGASLGEMISTKFVLWKLSNF